MHIVECGKFYISTTSRMWVENRTEVRQTLIANSYACIIWIKGFNHLIQSHWRGNRERKVAPEGIPCVQALFNHSSHHSQMQCPPFPCLQPHCCPPRHPRRCRYHCPVETGHFYWKLIPKQISIATIAMLKNTHLDELCRFEPFARTPSTWIRLLRWSRGLQLKRNQTAKEVWKWLGAVQSDGLDYQHIFGTTG